MTFVPQSPGWAPRVSRKNHREEEDFRIQGSLEALPLTGCIPSSVLFLTYKIGMLSWGPVCSFLRCSACLLVSLLDFLSPQLPGSRCGLLDMGVHEEGEVLVHTKHFDLQSPGCSHFWHPQ